MNCEFDPNCISLSFKRIFFNGHTLNCSIKSTLQAIDPENDPVSYSIVSGNDLRQFAIGDKSGVITVIRKLDREDLTRYQLVSRHRQTP